MNYEKQYTEVLFSGMFWEFHPELTGNWEKDKEAFIKEMKRLKKLRKKK